MSYRRRFRRSFRRGRSRFGRRIMRGSRNRRLRRIGYRM